MMRRMVPANWRVPVALVAALLCAPLVLVAFANVAVGDKVSNRAMPTLDGGMGHLLSDSEAGVFVFFRARNENSRTALRILEELRQEFEDRPLSWTAVVSDRSAVEEVTTEVKVLELGLVVLIDEGDELFGELGVRLHPVIGIVDADHVLSAYQPFVKVGLKNRLRARIRFALGEIDETELEAVLNPTLSQGGGDRATAARNLKLATMLFDAGKLDKAAERAQASLDADPALAGAHALLGRIAAASGDCAAARESFELALELDAEDASAIAGLEACSGE